MLSARIFLSTTRFISKSHNVFSRFPVKQIPRVKKAPQVEKPKNWESVGTNKLRPTSQLVRIAGFTVLTGVTTYTVAILAKNDQNELFLREKFKNWGRTELTWETATAVEKSTFIFFAMNTAVFLAWRITPLVPFMTRYFTNSYASKSLYLPMILSAFSHRGIIHFGMNMYVASTFLQSTMQNLVDPNQFWAFYILSAVFSSFVSLSEKAVRRTPVRSLGASGALMAVLCYLCMKFPDMKLQIIFMPGFQFSAEHAVYGMVAFDVICLLLGFQVFDHAAHLGGQLFGWFYAKHGQKLFWDDYSRVVNKARKSAGF